MLDFSNATPECILKYIEDNLLSSDRRTFEAQERSFFDYKDQFPFSFSDDYFFGIAKLICAFYNTFGGFIVFGVHDKERTPGHNKVKINIERLNSVLREKLSFPVECIHLRISLPAYASEQNGQVDVLIVPQRSQILPPVRFRKAEGRFLPTQIFFRRAHETLEAKSADFPFLFGPRNDLEISTDIEPPVQPIRAILPASPATMRTFVGRLLTLERLWTWLFSETEPRIFLYGKGGTGKSTIAFEFARLIAQNGSGFCTSSGKPLDTIIYVSAKKQEVISELASVSATKYRDFETSRDLFLSILYYSEWLEDADSQQLDDAKIEAHLKDLLNTKNILLIIDDIDTLTTQGLDPGIDTLYYLLVRARAGGKVIYTLRNAPTLSLRNSIEITGLEMQTEYPEFVKKCCEQFRQPEPRADMLYGTLARTTECIPLLIEVIVGLRRTCSSYDNAIEIFEKRTGTDVRRYLFDREYHSLAADNRARYLLAAISLFDQPVGMEELRVVLRYDREQISAAIGQVDEIFLVKLTSKDKDDTRYGLSGVTRAYISSKREGLERFPHLKATVLSYRRSFHPHEKEIASLRFSANQLLARGEPEEALRLLEDVQTTAKIAQHPEFQILLGVVLAKQSQLKLDRARECFNYCIDMQYENIEGMRVWYNMELYSGFGLENAISVCNHVLNGQRYTSRERGEFFAKRGFAYEKIGRNEFFINREKALRCFKEAVRSQLVAYDTLRHLPQLDINRNREWIARCISALLAKCEDSGGMLDALDVLQDVVYVRSGDIDHAVLSDPIVEPLERFFQGVGRRRHDKSKNASVGVCKKILSFVKNEKNITFEDKNNKEKLILAVSSAISQLEQR